MSIEKSTSGEFLDRKGEIETLASIARAALKGQATSLFLSGGRGTGKTELIRQLFNQLFTTQNDVIPFLYTVNPAFLSLRDFSRDYLTKFIQQAIAFLKKDHSIMNKPIYSPEDIRAFTDDTALNWALNLMDEYQETIKRGEPIQILLYSIMAPYRCYLSTGAPLVIMIDDFDRLKGVYNTDPGDMSDCYMFFEESIQIPYIPHIITGFREGLYDMFFNKTSIGEHLELMNLSGLDRDNTLSLFNSLCSIYNLSVINTNELIDLFHGNPLYIRKFVSALRRSGNMPHKDEVQRIYSNEVTRGGIYIYWLSHLKRYIPEVLRADSLNLLYHLCCDGLYEQFTPLDASSVIHKEKLDDVLKALRSAGVIEEGFTTFRLINDKVFVDVINALYQIEVLKGTPYNVSHGVMETVHEDVREIEPVPSCVTISFIKGSEAVAVKALEEVARKHDIPSEIIGKLQVATAELLNSLFMSDRGDIGRCNVRFGVEDVGFLIEVDVPAKELFVESAEGEASLRLIRGIIDDLRIERLQDFTRLRMLKKFRNNPVHTPFL